LKGVHLAIRSGMLAAEAIADALAAGDFSAAKLARYGELFEASWAKEELWRVRNWRQAFDQGLFAGMLDAGVQMLTGGRGLVKRRAGHADHETMRPVAQSSMTKPAFDGQLAMDKLTDVYHSGTVHDEDQRPHLLVTDTSICVRSLHRRIRQSLPALLSCRRLRVADRGPVRRPDQPFGGQARRPDHQFLQLRPLQDLRHRRPLRDHRMGGPPKAAGGPSTSTSDPR
jgi:hypothetical protein